MTWLIAFWLFAIREQDTVGNGEPAVSSKWLIILSVAGSLAALVVSLLTLVGAYKRSVLREARDEERVNGLGGRVDATEVSVTEHEVRFDQLETRMMVLERTAGEISRDMARVQSYLNTIEAEQKAASNQLNRVERDILVAIEALRGDIKYLNHK